MSAPTCVRCNVPKGEHADFPAFEAPEGVCPRYEAPAPRWLTAVNRAMEKFTGRPS